MAEGKRNILGKFVDLLSGKPSPEEGKDKEQENLFQPREEDPVDLTFVKNFTASGGKFLYCEDKDEAYRFIQMIMQESGLSKIFCQDPNLKSILNSAQVPYSDRQLADCDAFCAGCEYLVSFDGGIMITAKQTMGKKLNELPETFINIANTSQITENLRSALSGIRTKYEGDIPSQITTIKGPLKSEDVKEIQPGSVCTKEIYLILLEDQMNA